MCCWNMQGFSWKKRCLDGSRCSSRSLSQMGEPLLILTSAPLNCSFTPSHVTHLLPVNLINYQMLLLPLLAAIKFHNEVKFSMKFQTVLVTSDVLYVLLGIKFGFMRFASHCILFLFTLYAAIVDIYYVWYHVVDISFRQNTQGEGNVVANQIVRKVNGHSMTFNELLLR